MRTLHANWFYVAVATTGVVGLWGVGLAILKRTPSQVFRIATYVAIGVMLVQVGLGFGTLAVEGEPQNQFHVFYGFVILFTYTFAYIYRAQLAKRPALAYGLMLLFTMGLGLRAWANVA
jgi:predicted membrane channel-forming protein YqfA (hemolysin III family)